MNNKMCGLVVVVFYSFTVTLTMGQGRPLDHLIPPKSIFQLASSGSIENRHKIYKILMGDELGFFPLGYNHLVRVFVTPEFDQDYVISLEFTDYHPEESETVVYLNIADSNIYFSQGPIVVHSSKRFISREQAKIVHELFEVAVSGAKWRKAPSEVISMGGVQYHISVKKFDFEIVNPNYIAAAEISPDITGRRVKELQGIIERLKEIILESEGDALVLDDDFLEEIKALTLAFKDESMP